MPNLTALNHYRLLGRSGLRVSPLCLGTMTFGTEWGWGSEKKESEQIFRTYTERGGNFIDTANFYMQGTSEKLLGEFMKEERDRFVLATKYTLNMREGDPNAGGNHKKNLVQSIEASLQRLQTDYIDLYWVHMWDGITAIEEVMRALDDLVRSGKVLHIGVSNMPAWKVAEANTIAQLRGWSPFCALQVEHSLIQRTVERDLMPMAIDFGLGAAPWSPLGAGVLTGKYNRASGASLGDADAETQRNLAKNPIPEKKLLIAEEVIKVAEEIGQSPAQVALNWLLQQPGVTSPIVGARTLGQLEDNLGALDFTLSAAHLKQLSDISSVDLGFPRKFLERNLTQERITGKTTILPI